MTVLCAANAMCSSHWKRHDVRVFFPTSRWTCCRYMCRRRRRLSPVLRSRGRQCRRVPCCHGDITVEVVLITRRHAKWSQCRYSKPCSCTRPTTRGGQRHWKLLLPTLPILNVLPLRYDCVHFVLSVKLCDENECCWALILQWERASLWVLS